MPARTAADTALAADSFVEEWSNRGQEDQDTHSFWLNFLQDIMGISRAHHVINFEKRVRIGRSTKRIDAYIADSRVLIEQKSADIDLDAPQRQSDGVELTPYQQAQRYAQNLPPSETPLYIIVCNFKTFHIYDRENDPQGNNPIKITLEELPAQLPAFRFMTEPIEGVLARQEQANLEAARLIGDIYNAVKHQYDLVHPSQTDAASAVDPTSATTESCTRHDLAILMVRLLFCLYAEDSGLFDQRLFYDYLLRIEPGQGAFRLALQQLFVTLNTPIERRDPYLAGTTLARFPYVNGGLFADDITIPLFTHDIKHKLLHDGSAGFDWSHISPVIFGSIFESILSGDERRAGGMHYTSVDNIHKAIDPLFLDDLRSELNAAGNRSPALSALQEKIAGLKFLDPACGSGNFLTQTYLELRALENDILKRLVGDNMAFDFGFEGGGVDSTASSEAEVEEHVHSLVKVNVGQFYGIEINDFAVSVANAALWIADHQANQQTAKIFHRPLINLPLQDYQHIVVGNALRMDWNEVLPASECNYIMGNPPFLGARWMDASQKDDMLRTFNGARGIGNLDYVTAWYKKSAEYICETCIQAALVSTNSIAQGEQAGLLWKSLLDDNMKIDFAHRTFKWNSEARGVAAVHCVIIGFSKEDTRTKREIYFTDGLKKEAKTINPYLVDAPTVFVERRMSPLSAPHQMVFGSMPNDGGNLILSDEEKGLIEKMNPLTAKYIRRFMMGAEFINARIRWCLWLLDASPSDLHSMPEVMKRVERVRMHRASSHRDSTQKLAETPTLFGEIRQPSSDYIALPKVSSERRRYIPIGYLSAQVIAGDKLFVVPGGTLFDFGIMTSQFHNAWMRVVAGRLKSDYSYSNTIVYNNFVWPEPTDEQRERIEELAQVVLDARDNYPDSSLADLYDPLTMPPDLLRAHQALDKAVEQAYGVNFRGDETKIVSHLFKLYAEATKD